MIQIGLQGGGRFTIREDSCDVSAVTPHVLGFGLSHVTRFGGQAGLYSVGEHSVRMYDWAEKEGQDKAILRAILLHDGPECLGEGDHQRYVKRAFFGDGPKKYAHMVCTALWEKYVPSDRPLSQWSWDMVHEALRTYDEWIGLLEARAFGFPYSDPVPDWLDTSFAPRAEDHYRWTPHETRVAYAERWERCQ